MAPDNISRIDETGFEYIQDTVPTDATVGEAWVDTSVDPPKVRIQVGDNITNADANGFIDGGGVPFDVSLEQSGDFTVQSQFDLPQSESFSVFENDPNNFFQGSYSNYADAVTRDYDQYPSTIFAAPYNDASLYLLDRDTKEIRERKDVQQEITDLEVGTDGCLYATDDYRSIYRYRPFSAINNNYDSRFRHPCRYGGLAQDQRDVSDNCWFFASSNYDSIYKSNMDNNTGYSERWHAATNEPRGVTVDDDGCVWTAESSGYVQYNQVGSVITQVQNTTSEESDVIDYDTQTAEYLTVPNNSAIATLTGGVPLPLDSIADISYINGKYIVSGGTTLSYDPQTDKLDSFDFSAATPNRVSKGTDGSLYVAPKQDGSNSFNGAGSFVFRADANGNGTYGLKRWSAQQNSTIADSEGIAEDPDGSVWVSSQDDSYIAQFTDDGSLQTQEQFDEFIGSVGGPSGQPYRPGGQAFGEDPVSSASRFFLGDNNYSSIYVIEFDGSPSPQGTNMSFQYRFTPPSGGGVRALDHDPQTNCLYMMTESANSYIYRTNQTGSVISQIDTDRTPQTVAVVRNDDEPTDEPDALWVGDSSSIYVYDTNGNRRGGFRPHDRGVDGGLASVSEDGDSVKTDYVWTIDESSPSVRRVDAATRGEQGTPDMFGIGNENNSIQPFIAFPVETDADNEPTEFFVMNKPQHAPYSTDGTGRVDTPRVELPSFINNINGFDEGPDEKLYVNDSSDVYAIDPYAENDEFTKVLNARSYGLDVDQFGSIWTVNGNDDYYGYIPSTGSQFEAHNAEPDNTTRGIASTPDGRLHITGRSSGYIMNVNRRENHNRERANAFPASPSYQPNNTSAYSRYNRRPNGVTFDRNNDELYVADDSNLAWRTTPNGGEIDRFSYSFSWIGTTADDESLWIQDSSRVLVRANKNFVEAGREETKPVRSAALGDGFAPGTKAVGVLLSEQKVAAFTDDGIVPAELPDEVGRPAGVAVTDDDELAVVDTDGTIYELAGEPGTITFADPRE